MTTSIRLLTRDEIASDDFWQLLWEAAGVDSDAMSWVRDVELPELTVIGAVETHPICFAAYETQSSRIELHYIAVAEDRRGAGWGSRLIDAVRRARSDLPLHAQTDHDAVDFYRRLGFAVTPTARDPRWPSTPRFDCVMPAVGDPADVTLATYRHHALRYVQRTPATRSPLVDELLSLVETGARVLELGSGPGRDADALEEGGLSVDRTDGAASFVALQHVAGHTVRLLDVRDTTYGGPYDAVFANAVLLHVPRSRLRGVLRTALAATRPGGVIAASFKEGDGDEWSERKLEAPRYFTYWCSGPLTKAFQDAGWTDVQAKDATQPGASERWITVTARRPR